MDENDLGMGNWGITQGEGAARLMGGYTGKEIARGFVTIQTSGVRELALKLQKLSALAGDYKALERCVVEAAKHIEKGYKRRVGNVTGNLRKSVRTKAKVYPEDGGVIAITGPIQTGPVGSTPDQASGKHAWLKEFGTGPRRPGTQGRRTYLNVHQLINKRMIRRSSANDQQFQRMSRGYYFIMSSKNEPTRQARAGSGYPHDFIYTLGPNETYGKMPASNAMQNTISQEQSAVFSTLQQAIKNSIMKLS